MRILLVEDEKGVASFIKKGLEEERYTVDLMTNGEDGLHLALTETYDLLLLDVMLPKVNGFEICKTVRENQIQTPICMLSAKGSVQDKVQGLDYGADDYLTKPFSFEELLARVRALLRRKNETILELQVGNLKLNTQTHRIYVDQNEILLRPKEYAILEYLVRNEGRIISRTQILENIWGYNFDPNTNIVDVHIKSIRKKLSEFSEIDYIRTIRGMGYMIEDLK
ncbi:MAG: response regulator transcription factor [Deltaproteobacteria bacterium]|nr:response regulator transcription factor [Deltaproteobacteria bacterium]